MPTIEVIFDDLQNLVGKKLPKKIERLNNILAYVKGEAESFDGEVLNIEIKDGNRPDLWSVEGMARELRGALSIEEGLKDYGIDGYSGVVVDVESSLVNIRPFIACSVVKSVELNDDVIRGLMHLQDKLDQTYGRKRRRSSIGLYNFGLITPPIRYGVVKPKEVAFVPLEFNKELTMEEILKIHPKGQEYGHIVRDHSQYPILVDSTNKVLSFPPIINSDNLGRITRDVKDILVEVTGTVYNTVLNTLAIVTFSLADRGGKIHSVKINYLYGTMGVDFTPKLERKEIRIETGYVNKVLGLNLDMKTILKLLRKARYEVSYVEEDYSIVKIPCYRIDIMHPIDVVEDVAIIYGYNNIQPRWPSQITFGKLGKEESFSDIVREVMIGLGFQETLNFTMNNPENLFDKMNLEKTPVVMVSNPENLRYTCVRSWLMPSLIEFLSYNRHVDYPQRIFEVGDCSIFNEMSETGIQNVRKLACLITHHKSNFSEAKGILDSLSQNIGFKYQIEETKHDSFINGRVGRVLIGFEEFGVLGEINPLVLEKWELENPVAGFELDLDKIFRKNE